MTALERFRNSALRCALTSSISRRMALAMLVMASTSPAQSVTIWRAKNWEGPRKGIPICR